MNQFLKELPHPNKNEKLVIELQKFVDGDYVVAMYSDRVTNVVTYGHVISSVNALIR